MIERATGNERTMQQVDGRRIRAVAASFDGRSVAIGHDNGAIAIRDAVRGGLRSLLQGHTTTAVYSVEFSPDGARLVSGGEDARVVLWDPQAGDDVLALQPHDGYVHVVACSPDGTRILSGSGDGTLRIWDSVPLLERSRQVRTERALRAELRPHVEHLLQQLDDPALVAARLRADPDPRRRSAALRELLALCMASR